MSDVTIISDMGLDVGEATGEPFAQDNPVEDTTLQENLDKLSRVAEPMRLPPRRSKKRPCE